MMMRSTLIIFVKFPRAGEVKTRLGKSIGMEEAVEVYRQFAEHAFLLADDVESQGVRVYIFSVPGAAEKEVKKWVGRPFTFVEQEGESLGERMKNAFDRTFADGATQIVIIGTDVPELDSNTIQSALRILSTHDIVIGPSTDGGYYLLGMKSPAKNVFEGIDWSTEYVFQQTIDKVKALHLSFATLPSFTDVDTEEDYCAYLERSFTDGIILRIKRPC